MESYQLFIVICIVFVTVGLGLVVYFASLDVPSAYKTFLGIPYDTNPEYAARVNQKIGGLLAGFTLIGAGIGSGMSTAFLYELEKTDLTSVGRKYCQSCGAKNPTDSAFCGKCGKKIPKS